uniref:Thyroid hormone receptor associated protein 3 n=1 Tax=Myripristis murdjan TaxID=586833 RepID=A0A667ZCG4_9TELE
SRSRSHSPSHNRDKKYPRGYQNNREFRGYHRGFRRPYYLRGRGRGYFPRGRYQRGGGGGGYNNNFRSNWKNHRQHPQQQHQQQQQQQNQNHLRERSPSPRKRSGSPVPYSHSQQYDRSASPVSRHSQHSSSSSHSSSPKYKSALGLGGGGGGGDGESELTEVSAGGVKEGSAGGKPAGNWQCLTDYNNSPVACSAVNAGQNTQTNNQSSPSLKNTIDVSNGSPSWQIVGSSSSTKNPSEESPTSMLSSLGFFSKEDLDGDKAAISIAFKNKNMEANDVDVAQAKANGKVSAAISDSVSRKYKEDCDGDVSLNSFLKASPFLSADGEEEEEMTIKPHSPQKDWHNGDECSKPKSKVTRSARELFEERFSKWESLAYPQVAKNSDLDAMAEEIYLSRKQDKAAAIAAALTKREMAGMLEDLSPERGCNARRMAKSASSPSPTPPARRKSDREMYRAEDSPLKASRKREAKFNVRMDFLGDILTSSSDVLAEERQLSQDLVQSSKKDQEFRSIFQHVKNTQLQRSPSELFAQHIVAIVHHIKAQHFPPSGMTLNERFAMYQRRAAEKEMMKPRKSPEIHRRIDVSPSAFKKHSQLFEAMKEIKVCVTLRHFSLFQFLRILILLYLALYTHPLCVRWCTVSPFRKSKKKRSRSSSSSSSSSSNSHKEEDFPLDKLDAKDVGFNKARLGPRDSSASVERGRPRGGFVNRGPFGSRWLWAFLIPSLSLKLQQFRIRGRAWNRGNYQGNGSHSNPVNIPVHMKNEDWDPEYTPKSKKYYLHDDRDREAEGKWLDNRGRGRGSFLRGRARFTIRRDNGKSPKWAHDKFNGEQEGEIDGDAENT